MNGVRVHDYDNIHPEFYKSGAMSSHGMPLNYVGGNVKVSPDLHYELAGAAINQEQAVM